MPDLLLKTAQLAFNDFCQGLATQNWEPFLDWLTEDFRFWFPVGSYRGWNPGKEQARAFFAYVSSVFNEGLEVTLKGITWNETTVTFEFYSQGRLRGQPYENQGVVIFEFREDKICSYREYFSNLA